MLNSLRENMGDGNDVLHTRHRNDQINEINKIHEIQLDWQKSDKFNNKIITLSHSTCYFQLQINLSDRI